MNEVIISLGCGCILPIVAIFLGVRQMMNETNKRTEIVLAAIEKNPDMDIEELIKKISPKKKLLKEKLLSKLQWGCLTALLGLGFVGYGSWLGYVGGGGSNDPMASACIGLVLLAVGITFLVNYSMGKKMLAKEMEAEEKQLIADAEK